MTNWRKIDGFSPFVSFIFANNSWYFVDIIFQTIWKNPKLNMKSKYKYRISSYSFSGNYSFFDLEIQKSQYIRPKVTVQNVRKLFKGRNYSGARKLYEEIRYENSFIVSFFRHHCVFSTSVRVFCLRLWLACLLDISIC